MKVWEWFKGLFEHPFNFAVPTPPPEKKQHGIKCEGCGTWTSELTDGEAFASKYVYTDDPKELKAIFTCGKCHHVSEWFTGAPMPIKYSDVRKVENA